MRILLLSNHFPPNVHGGAEILASDVAGGLRALGHDVQVLTGRAATRDQPTDDSVWRVLRPPLSIYPERRWRRKTPLRQVADFYAQAHCPANARRLQEAVATFDPDILYVWDISGIGIISILAALARVPVPIVFHLGSYWWQYINWPETPYSRLRLRWLKKLIIGRVPALTYTTLIATSQAVKQKYVQSGCRVDRIEVIDNAIDDRFLAPPLASPIIGDDPRAKRPQQTLIYAGRLCVEKGVLVALQALDRIVNHAGRCDIRLEIFGSGDPAYVEALRAFTETHGMADRVTFHGQVAQDRLIAAYDRAQVLLVPSLWEEPFGLVAIEAMARGLPVIASNVGGLASIIRDGRDGLLVPAGDPAALAASIVHLMDGVEERGQLAMEARQTVRERFTLAACIDRIEDHLQQALALQSTPSSFAIA